MTGHEWTVQEVALNDIASALRRLASAIACPPGPCSSAHRSPFATIYERKADALLACELRAGHAGDHEWHDPDARGYCRWTDAGATSRDVADEEPDA